MADSTFPNGTGAFGFSVTSGESVMTLADSTFMPVPTACPETGACTELSHYIFSDVAEGTVVIRETQPPEDYTFGRVLFTPGSGDDATLVSTSADGVIVLNTTNDDSVMLHVYNFTGEGGISPGSQPPSTSPSSGGAGREGQHRRTKHVDQRAGPQPPAGRAQPPRSDRRPRRAGHGQR